VAKSRNTQTAIYTRISRDITGEGEGVKNQKEECEKLAAALGLEVSAAYSDNDIGASNRTGAKLRPEYEAMLEAVRAGAIGTIIAYSNSRLTRRPKEWIELISLAESGKLQIKTVASGSHDLTTADGRAVALTVAAWDAAESERISERQTLTFERKAYEGKPKVQRQRPFGWEDDGITIREDEARHIRSAIEQIKAGASVASIQHSWNQAGIRTAVDPEQSKKETKPDGQWEWSVVYRVLLGWRTAGIRTRYREPLRDADGHLVRGMWEPIISLADREQALAMLTRLSRTKLRSGSWPLAGILRCGECTKPLYGQLPSGTRGRALYACKKGHVGISAGLLEQYLIQESVRRAYEASERGVTTRPEPNRAEDWPHLDELNAVTQLFEEATVAWKTRTLPTSVAFKQITELEPKRNELQKQLDAFLSVEPAPQSPLRTSGQVLEWLMEMQGPFLRETPRPFVEWEDRPGDSFDPKTSEPATSRNTRKLEGKKERQQELPYAATPEETEELNRVLRGELEMVVIRKGKAGRQSAAQFEARIDPVWRD
jgi:site-specific DNA recombinase